ncbi:MAG: adenylosuccinate synthase, partial [Phycisphaerae bacterium]|nr:adenylosuccinate synthase [Phycisphaerae bacterium]
HDIVVRFNGGNNAGHTVSFGGQTFKLHLMPSGIFHENVTCVIGPGVVVDPGVLLGEIDSLADRGIEATGRLKISDSAHVILPYHKKQEELNEKDRGKGKIGTTLRGIGPCYAEKMNRASAVRMCDLVHADRLRAKISSALAAKNDVFVKVFGEEPMSADEIAETYGEYAARLAPMVCNTTDFLHNCLDGGKRILFEGAQGTLLDIDHGTYPYVTSSNASACGVWSGSGVPAKRIDKFIGVMKAYTTRVGEGPFPTELPGPIGERIRERGNEYGTTTGRARRCGWFDAVAVRHSVRLGGIDSLAMMLLDVLSGFDELKVCTGYKHGDKVLPSFTTDSAVLAEVEPVLVSFKGWEEDISGVRRWEDLPPAARSYVEHVELLVGVRIGIVSVGPARDETIIRKS